MKFDAKPNIAKPWRQLVAHKKHESTTRCINFPLLKGPKTFHSLITLRVIVCVGEGSQLCNRVQFLPRDALSAKRRLAIACRLSVRLFVTLVDCDHICWNSSEIISRLVSLQRSQWRAYRKPPSLFRMVPSLTPTTSPCPKMWIPYAPRYAKISPQRVIRYTSCLVLG